MPKPPPVSAPEQVNDDPEIVLDQIQFTYPNGVTALRDLSLHVQPGEQVAIIGQNGSGKTTLARHLNGLLRPQRGTITIGGRETSRLPVAQLARQVGYLFQNPDAQLFKRSIAAEVAFGPRMLGYPPERIQALVAAALQQTGLTAVADQNPHDLGRPRRRRVALAAILAMDTPILVLDEPTTGQDARFHNMLGRLLETWRQSGRTVITISHDLDFVAAHFSRLIVMHEGRILRDAPLQTLIGNSALLGQTGVLPPAITQLGQLLQLPQTVWSVEQFLHVLQTRKEQGSDRDS